MSHSWLKRAEESNNGLFSVMSGDCEFACLGLGVVNWLTFDAILNEIGPSDVQKHSHMTQKWMLLHCLSLLTFSTENDSWHFHNWPLCAFLLHKWQEMPSDTVYVWHLIQCELKTTHGEHFSVSNATVQFHVTLLELSTQTFTTHRAQNAQQQCRFWLTHDAILNEKEQSDMQLNFFVKKLNLVPRPVFKHFQMKMAPGMVEIDPVCFLDAQMTRNGE